MKDMKTTITAVVGAVAVLLGATGLVYMSVEVQVAIVTITLALVAWFAKDATKTTE